MQIIFGIFLTLHVIGGSIGLMAGTINMIRKKGDKRHKIIGKLFLYGMLTAGLSALVLSAMRSNLFLFITGIFTIYLVGTGVRYLFLRKLTLDQKPKGIDWALTVMMLVFGIAFVGYGLVMLAYKQTFGIVLIVFGFIGLLSVKQDIKNYKGKAEVKNNWLIMHLQRMIAGYIAALTAFLVVNVHGLLPHNYYFIEWLLPTVLLTPLIFKWVKKYTIKSKKSLQQV